MFISRLITSCVIIPFVLFIVFYLPTYWFALAASVIVLWAAWEWTHIMRMVDIVYRIAYVFIVLLAMVLISRYWQEYIQYIFLLAGLWWLLAMLLIVAYPKLTVGWKHRPIKALIGLLLLVPAWLAIVHLHYMEQGVWLILYLFLLVWGADTGAYFAGKCFGKRKLIPRVSPGKSWEGVAGAIATVVTLAVVVHIYFDIISVSMFWLIALSIMVLFASVVGDLLESMFKRHGGIKDSGHLLPGHGGIMDRIDSLTAAAPIFVLCLNATSL